MPKKLRPYSGDLRLVCAHPPPDAGPQTTPYPDRIVGIDPGPTATAWCVLERGVPSAWALEPNTLVLDSDWGCRFAVESIRSYGARVGAETFDTCYVIGRLLARLEDRGRPGCLVTRLDVKLHHTGTARANDAGVRQALQERLDRTPAGTPRGLVGDDCWSALAIALYAWDQSQAAFF